MQDKRNTESVVQEIMGLVDVLVESIQAHIGTDCENSAYQAIESKLRELVENKFSVRELEAAQAQRVPLSDEQIEDSFIAAGGRWADDSYWVIEDADLHPFVRGITQEKQG